MEFAGVLAEDYETNYEVAFINTHGVIQFQIKLITVPPESFPRDIECVTAYASDFDFIDNLALEPEERIKVFLSELKDSIFFFNVYVSNESYYKATNITLTKKSENFNRNESLKQCPVYSSQAHNISQEVFKEKLISNGVLPLIKQLSKEEDDIPFLIAWEDEDSCTFYGEIDSFTPNYNNVRWKISNLKELSIKKINSESYLYDCYFHNEIIYIPENIENKIINELKDVGKSDSKGEKTIIKEKTSSDLEEQFMERFSYICRKRNLFYEDKDLYNFHTSIKTGNLVVLAGMSGTGKSKLVQCYAEAMKLSKEQLLFIPVRPYWQDDSDVIGYLDTMNNVYRPGDSGLVNLLIEAQNSPNEMFIVCFDEMNIARVEHYFSQLLSVLELDSNKKELRLYNDDYQAKIYNGNSYNPTIKIGQNILFVGTVNLDESTFHFSDKVLDRANVMNLEMVPYYDVSSVIKDYEVADQKEISTDSIKSIQYLSFRNNENDINLLEKESRILWDIHLEIQKNNKNFGVGWRIVKQISTYLNNLPKNSPLKREEAFDLQIVQRVLTKIRGNNEALQSLLGVYDEKEEAIKESTIIKILEKHSEYEFTHVKTSLINKSRELDVYGYTV